MKQSDLKISALKFYPILLLEEVLPHNVRHSIFFINKILALGFILAYSIAKMAGVPDDFIVKILGLFLLFFGFAMSIRLLEAFFRSYFDFVPLSETEAGKVLLRGKNGDLVRALFMGDFGKKLVGRLNLENSRLSAFLARRNHIYNYELPKFRHDGLFGIAELAKALLDQDREFKEFLFEKDVGERDLLGALEWVVSMEKFREGNERWWSRDSLSQIPAIGKDWAFGRTPELDSMGRDLSRIQDLFLGSEKSFRDDLVSDIEDAFAKSKEANVLLVGDPGVGTSGVVLDFVRKITTGKVRPEIAFSRVVELDTTKLVSLSKDKVDFEKRFLSVLNEALFAGDIILVVNDFPSFMASAIVLGSDVVSLLSKFLDTKLQFIIVSDTARFHSMLLSNLKLLQYFDKISVSEPDGAKTLEIVENFVRDLEAEEEVFFTYKAVTAIIMSAINYFSSGVMPNKAIDLVREIVAQGGKGSIVTKDIVMEFVSGKTKMPLGKIVEGEKETLLNLETELHKRIVGQTEAVDAISKAMRRARAGVRDQKKPIGSFLFLGPTGVGKTEAGKALSAIFFGDDKYMLRLDMSEYQEAGSLSKLIGDFKIGKSGVLSDMLRDNPYGVLLLDEFEKSDKQVLNLFLQILDEGFFSDMNGRKVSTRNILFIATSNAASDMIFELANKGEDLSLHRDKIISKIVGDGVYRPELVNRFDDVIVFHPLTPDELKQIAVLMLKKLGKRLAEKGVNLVINDTTVARVVEAGYNKTFGARPMARAIQELIEEPVARKIIEGSLAPGATFEL
ncbi:MAG: ATP-dependent Clp protease ATP-binding subunit [Candidatus Vogelbacteria bacterium]|nr:ATP-dependent Clp protease ATP-binding subunit [Candidatus Vogelbacteria bacterium]